MSARATCRCDRDFRADEQDTDPNPPCQSEASEEDLLCDACRGGCGVAMTTRLGLLDGTEVVRSVHGRGLGDAAVAAQATPFLRGV